MGITNNCYRLHAVIWDHSNQDLVQLDCVGTLAEVLRFLMTRMEPEDHIQLLVLENEDCYKCVDWAVLKELSLMGGALESLAEDALRQEFMKIYCRDVDKPSLAIFTKLR